MSERSRSDDSPEEATRPSLGAIYVVAAITLSVVTKFVWFGPLTPIARGYGHDVTLPIFGYFCLRPGMDHCWTTGMIVFGVCVCGEVLQRLNLPMLNWLPVFGGTFDYWDFAAYALGIAVAVGLDILDRRL